MADATHDPRAWRVATALAHATGLDWARCRSECPSDKWRTGGARCIRPLGHTGTCESFESGGGHWAAPEPVPAPWDTDAYLADCRRRNVEPGPLPSLRHNSDEVFWAVGSRTVDPSFVAYIETGTAVVEVLNDGRMRVFDAAGRSGMATVVIDDLVRATNLARVAAEAMR